VEFNLSDEPTTALKFVGHLYSQTELGKRAVHEDETPWTACLTPDGRRLMGIPLATGYRHEGEPRFLMLTGERIARVSEDSEVFLTFLGGFDPLEIAFNHNQDTGFLMLIYPAFKSLSDLSTLERLIDFKRAD